MRIALSILISIVIVACIAAIQRMFYGEDQEGDEKRSVFDSSIDWTQAIVAGVLVGLVHYFTPKLAGGWLWLAPVFLIAMLSSMAAHRGSSPV